MDEEEKRTTWIKVKGDLSLPALSRVTAKLMELACDDDTSPVELSGLIEKDPSLTIRILKVANSAFFKPRYPITTVNAAVMRMGFQQLRVLALTLSLKETFPMGKEGPINYEEFWKASLYRGILAKLLARELKTCDEDEAFTTGLTLEIGFLILVAMFGKGKDRVVDPGEYPLEILLSTEENKYGFNHREIGEAALEQWKFPEEIVECQRYYGRNRSAPAARDLPGICRVAGELAALICYEKADFYEVYHAIESTLGINHASIDEIVITALREVDEVARSLDLDVRGETGREDLIRKANNALTRIWHDIQLPACPPSEEETAGAAGVIRAMQAVAHEIRNPLAVVGGFARKLAGSVDPSSKEWEYAEVILAETQRLEKVLNEMLGASMP